MGEGGNHGEVQGALPVTTVDTKLAEKRARWRVRAPRFEGNSFTVKKIK
jgi:hypothetical protein